jgi:hypothetical protein
MTFVIMGGFLTLASPSGRGKFVGDMEAFCLFHSRP